MVNPVDAISGTTSRGEFTLTELDLAGIFSIFQIIVTYFDFIIDDLVQNW